ncbi:hypothetical protein C8R43DRAFT_943689 [Mycena crocata]|nr:hypothetical protein C8R43DRAFT_943689 [Mycena crocata]
MYEDWCIHQPACTTVFWLRRRKDTEVNQLPCSHSDTTVPARTPLRRANGYTTLSLTLHANYLPTIRTDSAHHIVKIYFCTGTSMIAALPPTRTESSYAADQNASLSCHNASTQHAVSMNPMPLERGLSTTRKSVGYNSDGNTDRNATPTQRLERMKSLWSSGHPVLSCRAYLADPEVDKCLAGLGDVQASIQTVSEQKLEWMWTDVQTWCKESQCAETSWYARDESQPVQIFVQGGSHPSLFFSTTTIVLSLDDIKPHLTPPPHFTSLKDYWVEGSTTESQEDVEPKFICDALQESMGWSSIQLKAILLVSLVLF